MQPLPESLIHELAERRCLVILGAGVSASSSNEGSPPRRPPTWPQFLKAAAGLISDEAADHARALIDKERFLDAAQVVRDEMNGAEFADFIRSEFVEPRYRHSDLHRHIADLDSKIYLTTNYDTIFEDYLRVAFSGSGFNVCRYYETHALNDIRSTQRVVLKAHGCVADPSRIVLSRTEYYRARRDCQEFYSIVDALFLVNTLLFIGCGLNDPDIMLLLENANLRAKSVHPHYAIVESDRHDSLTQAFKTTHNLELLEYPSGQHKEVVEVLQDAVERVALWRSTH